MELKLVWWHIPVIIVTWEAEAGGSQVQGQPWQLIKTLSQNKIFWCWDCGSLGEHLPHMCEAVG